MPITPIGVRTRAMSRPLGRVQRAISSPTGSGSAGNRLDRRRPWPRRALVQHQPVDHRRRRRHVLRVGGEDRVAARPDRIGHRPGSPPTAARRRLAQGGGCPACFVAHVSMGLAHHSITRSPLPLDGGGLGWGWTLPPALRPSSDATPTQPPPQGGGAAVRQAGEWPTRPAPHHSSTRSSRWISSSGPRNPKHASISPLPRPAIAAASAAL